MMPLQSQILFHGNRPGLLYHPDLADRKLREFLCPVVEHFSGKIPILGVCLGHQAIAAAFGGKVVAAKRLMHGKTSMIHADGKMMYQGIHKPFEAMRYHSLAVSRENFPDCLEISSEADDGEIMGIRHKEHPKPKEFNFIRNLL